jgi:TP901 family phage tail tape measure protein
MPGDIILDVQGNLAPIDRQFDIHTKKWESQINRVFSNGLGGNRISPALGRISGSFREFDKSLEASNARVLAFGASAGIVLGVQRAMANMVRTTIEVEKSLKDINVILSLNTKNLQSFGAELFNIAKNTGQSFKVVASAATELARQGLGVEQTLKRTRDAMILTRQSGLDIVSSVEAITAALNSFNKTTIDSTALINKLANVDAQFAVSSGDLAEAIKRVGSSAQDANVSIDELLGLVTAIQQRTARGGAVIGNALKSVFARISRPEVIDQLRELGVSISASQNGIDKLKSLSSALKGASPAMASTIKELSGGVYQINIVSAALNELQNQYNTVTAATQAATNATDQAIQRNEELNKTLASLTNKTVANLSQVFSQFGKLTINPVMERWLGAFNELLEGAVSDKSENFGEILGKGIISGLGQYLSGPGVAVIGIGVFKLVNRLAADLKVAGQTILGLNTAANDQAILQKNITSYLAQNPQLINLATQGEKGKLAVLQQITAQYEAQAGLLARSSAIAKDISSSMVRQGFATVKDRNSPIAGSVSKTPVKFAAGGYVSNFANPLAAAISREHAAGVPFSSIRVGASSQLSSSGNPAGLGVYNTIHEPMGLGQGINRAISQGINPKSHGIPNYAKPEYESTRFGSTFLDKYLTPEIIKLRGLISNNKTTFTKLDSTIKQLGKTFELTAVSTNKLKQQLLYLENTRVGDLPSSYQAGLVRYPSQLPGRQLVRTGLLRRLSGTEADLLRSGSIDISPERQKLIGYKSPAGLLKSPAVFALPAPSLSTSGGTEGYSYLSSASPAYTKASLSTKGGTRGYSYLSSSSPAYVKPPGLSATGGTMGYPYLSSSSPAYVKAPSLSTTGGTMGYSYLSSTQPPPIINDSMLKRVGISGGGYGSPIYSNIGARYGAVGSEQRSAIARERALRRYGYDSKIRRAYGSLRDSNLPLGLSFGAPMAAGFLSESIGQETEGSRRASAAVTSLGNVASYTATAALVSKNPYAAAATAAIASTVEINKLIKVWRDKTPELEKAMASYKESIDKNNENLQGLITSTESLRGIRRGEVSATPYQYGEIVKRSQNQIAGLALSVPGTGGEVSKAVSTGDFGKVEELVNKANLKLEMQRKASELEVFRNNKLLPPTLGERASSLIGMNPSKYLIDKSYREKINSSAREAYGETSFGNSPLNFVSNLAQSTKRFSDVLSLNETKKKDVGLFMPSFLGQQGPSGQSIMTSLIENYQKNPSSSIARDISKSIVGSDIEGIRSGLTGVAGRMQGEFNLAPEQLAPFLDFIKTASEPQIREAIKTLEVVGEASQKRMMGILDITKMANNSEMVSQKFTKLATEMETFIERVKMAGEETVALADHQRKLEQLQKTGRDVGVVSRLSRANPFGMIEYGYQRETSAISDAAKTRRDEIQNEFRNKQVDVLGNFTSSLAEVVRGGYLKSSSLGGAYESSAVGAAGQIFGISTSKVTPSTRKSGPKRVNASLEDVFYEILAKGKNLSNEGDVSSYVGNLSKYKDSLESEMRKGELGVGSFGREAINKIIASIDKLQNIMTLAPEQRDKEIKEVDRQSKLAALESENKKLQEIQDKIASISASYADYTQNVKLAENYARSELDLRDRLGKTGMDLYDIENRILSTRLKSQKAEYEIQIAIGKGTAQMLQQITMAEKLQKIRTGGGVSGRDVSDVIGARLTYTSEDQFTDIIEMADKVTLTMKEGFKDAFMEFATGAKSASEAMRELGMTIAKEVLGRVTSMAFDTFFNGIKGAFTGRSSGGIVGYAGGGMVRGGSGMRDDVPAMLPAGSYVIKKSAVGKYGSGMLNALANGGMPRFAVGGGVNVSLKNQYAYNSEKYPTKGWFDVDPRLSTIGQTDENNPQNALKFGREQDFIAYQDTIRQHKTALKQYKAAQTQSFIASMINTGMLVGGSYLSGAAGRVGGASSGFSYTGAEMKAYSTRPTTSGGFPMASGGYSRDTIPALLTGGEYVMSPSAVKQHGVGFMNSLNSGRISKYQTGGLVGRDTTAINPAVQGISGDGWQQVTSAILKLVDVSEEIRDNSTNKDKLTTANTDSQATAPVTNNTVTINISSTGSSNNASSSSESDNKDKETNLKKFSEMMKSIALETIIKEQRPGGLLAG